MARMLLSLLATLLLAVHSHPAGLECGTDATSRLQEGKTIMNSVVAKAPADAPIKVKVQPVWNSHLLFKVTITSKAGILFAARAFGDRAKVVNPPHTNLNMTENCSKQVFVSVGMENSTTYTFYVYEATSIVVGYHAPPAPGVVSLVTAKVHSGHANFAEIAAHVNSLQTTWQAKTPKFESFDHVIGLCGSILPGEDGYKAPAVEKEDDSSNMDIPDEFDVRTKWPKCASVSGHIRDQSECGSCWAHGATEAFNDRVCIVTGETALLSTDDTLANSGAGSCGGGFPGGVWEWFKSTGVVTGGDYTDIGKGDTCAPYSLPTCQHHNWKPPTPQHPACPKKDYPTPKRFSKCQESGYKKPYHQDKVKAASSYSISGEKNIQSDIMQYGSVSATFTVYSDLPTYSTGVYQHTSGSVLGGHAVKMMGWGTYNGTPYWLIANSWNTDWGDKGFFKILRGKDECGIESGLEAGHVAKSIELV